MQLILDERNQAILARNIAAYNEIKGPRVGDFLELPRISKHQKHDITRFTAGWDDHIQTGRSCDGSFHLGNGYVSFSGSLEPGVQRDDIVATDHVRRGSCWFFRDDYPGAGRGLYTQAEFRVFKLRDGANLDGLWLIQAPSVNIHDDEHVKQYNCSRFSVHDNVGFDIIDDFKTWLAENDLKCDSFEVGHHRLVWMA